MFILRDLIGAGMETTATFIRWAIVVLTNHVSVQERLHAEIDSVIGGQRLPALDDRSKLVDENTISAYILTSAMLTVSSIYLDET